MSGSVALRVVRNSGAVMTNSNQDEVGVLAAAAWTASASGVGPGMRKGAVGRDGRRPLHAER